jgi:glucosamine kinase
MSLFLAIDAGGTKTECLLADDRRVLARASTGTVKLMRISEEEATRRLLTLLEEVAGAAGASLDQVTRTCFGLAGITSPAVRAWARQVVPAMVAGEFLLCGDEEIALDAAFAGGPGILVIAGTGSNVVGRSESGTLFGVGGWGPVLGDEGSGYWIGLEALRAALRAHDGGLDPSRVRARVQARAGLDDNPSFCLLREIEEHWELGSLAELVAFANQRSGLRRPAPDFAALAPVVARCAESGDALAASVLERAGRELAEQVALVSRKMAAERSAAEPRIAASRAAAGAARKADSSAGVATAVEIDAGEGAVETIGVAFTGSVLTHIAPVRAAMLARLAILVPNVRVPDSPVDPLDGALWRARHG